jgi:uncharacterized protein
MAAAPSAKFQDSRPAFFVDGQESASLAQGLLGMSIEEDTRGLYRSEISFGNWSANPPVNGFVFFDRKTLDFGKSLEVKVSGASIFQGAISALEAGFPEGQPPTFTVLVEDRLQKLRMTRRTRSFSDVSDSDIFQRIAGEHGLTPKLDLDGPTYKSVAQVNQSDLAFLRERARAVDAELWIERTELHAQQRANRNGGSTRLGLGNELFEFNVAADLAGQRTSVTVNGWDVSAKTAISHEAGKQAIQSELGNDDGGATILSSAFGDRKESVDHTVPLNTAEARSLAEGYYRSIARQFVIGKGRAQTSSQLRVGSFVELTGIGPIFSGKYYLTHVKHSFDGTAGLKTEFTAERPGIGKP